MCFRKLITGYVKYVGYIAIEGKARPVKIREQKGWKGWLNKVCTNRINKKFASYL